MQPQCLHNLHKNVPSSLKVHQLLMVWSIDGTNWNIWRFFLLHWLKQTIKACKPQMGVAIHSSLRHESIWWFFMCGWQTTCICTVTYEAAALFKMFDSHATLLIYRPEQLSLKYRSNNPELQNPVHHSTLIFTVDSPISRPCLACYCLLFLYNVGN